MDKKKKISFEKKASTLGKKGKKLGAPDFDSMLDPTGLPGLPENNQADAEDVVNQETADMMAMIRETRKNNAERFRDIEAGEFWFCVCFQSRSQKEEFIRLLLEKYAPNNSHENFGDKYLSGLELAEMLGVSIQPITLEVKKNRLAPKSLRGMEVI